MYIYYIIYIWCSTVLETETGKRWEIDWRSSEEDRRGVVTEEDD